MKLNIAVLPGDGIGPEVTAQAIKVLNAIAVEFNHTFNYKYAPVGAIAIDEQGDPLPESTLDICKASDAILFGAIGDPKYDNDPSAKIRPEQGLLKLRKELGLFANIRPVKAYDTLIKEGKTLETKSNKIVKNYSNKAEKRFTSIRKVADKQFNKVENLFETKIEKVLKKLDIPTVKDINGLSNKVELLVKEMKSNAKKAA